MILPVVLQILGVVLLGVSLIAMALAQQHQQRQLDRLAADLTTLRQHLLQHDVPR